MIKNWNLYTLTIRKESKNYKCNLWFWRLNTLSLYKKYIQIYFKFILIIFNYFKYFYKGRKFVCALIVDYDFVIELFIVESFDIFY